APPGHRVVTVRVGMVMSGVNWIGRPAMANAPKSTTRTTPTNTVTGRATASSMKLRRGSSAFAGLSTGIRLERSCGSLGGRWSGKDGNRLIRSQAFVASRDDDVSCVQLGAADQARHIGTG